MSCKNRKQQLESNLAAGLTNPVSKQNHHQQMYLGLFIVACLVIAMLFYPGMILLAAVVIFASGKFGVSKWVKNNEKG